VAVDDLQISLVGEMARPGRERLAQEPLNRDPRQFHTTIILLDRDAFSGNIDFMELRE
jgi:hypothetical protein